MRSLFYRRRFIFIPFAVAAFLALISFVVMTLWNYLLPGILHVDTIDFWQAMGIFVLCKILFGFGKGGHRMNGGAPWMRRKMEDRFKNMSAEEKEMFRARMKNHNCGRRGWDKDTNWDNFKPEAEKAAE
jgi:hypothetical protein